LLFAWAMLNSDLAARIWGPVYLGLGLAVFPLFGRKAKADLSRK